MYFAVVIVAVGVVVVVVLGMGDAVFEALSQIQHHPGLKTTTPTTVPVTTTTSTW